MEKLIWIFQFFVVSLQSKTMSNMKLNLKMLVLGLMSFGIVGGLMMGKVQEVIYFQDPLNEMVLALLMSVMGVGFIMSSFEKKVSNI